MCVDVWQKRNVRFLQVIDITEITRARCSAPTSVMLFPVRFRDKSLVLNRLAVPRALLIPSTPVSVMEQCWRDRVWTLGGEEITVLISSSGGSSSE